MEKSEITLEKIELVKDRTGVSYREAKQALEKNNADVVEAIIYIEDSINQTGPAEGDGKVNGIVAEIKEAVRKGNVSKITIKKNDDILLNLPVNVGILGTVLFPWAVIAGIIAAAGTKCKVELVKENGEVVDVSAKASTAYDAAVVKGGVVVDEVKDKSAVYYKAARDKGAEYYKAAKDKGGDLVEHARDKASDLKTRAEESGLGGFDDLDLDLSDVDIEELDKELEQTSEEIKEELQN